MKLLDQLKQLSPSNRLTFQLVASFALGMVMAVIVRAIGLDESLVTATAFVTAAFVSIYLSHVLSSKEK